MTLPSYKEIWKISGPIILSLVAQNLINVINTAFLGRVGEIELGASAIGGLFYISIYMLGFGFATGTQIIIGRRNGEKDYKELGNVFDNSLFFLVTLSVIIFLLVKTAIPPLLGSIIKSKDIFDASITYLNYRFWGIFFAFANCLFRSFYVGTTNTRLITWSAIIMALLNIFFDYVLIFGKLGFPQWGLKGAALASVIAEITATIFFILVTYNKKNLAKYHFFETLKPNFTKIKSIFHVASPIMVQNFVSLGSWFLFFLIIEQMGEHSLAVSNLIRTIYLVLMVPVWGFCSTTNTMVSNTIGENRKRIMTLIIRRISKLSFLCTSVLVILSAAFPSLIISLFTNNTQLISDTIPSLYMITGALLLFSITMILFSSISGTGNTRMALLIEMITLGFYLLTAYILWIYLKFPVHVIWLSEYVYFLVIGIISYYYLKHNKWNPIKI